MKYQDCFLLKIKQNDVCCSCVWLMTHRCSQLDNRHGCSKTDISTSDIGIVFFQPSIIISIQKSTIGTKYKDFYQQIISNGEGC